jgi:hypothetical protein
MTHSFPGLNVSQRLQSLVRSIRLQYMRVFDKLINKL